MAGSQNREMGSAHSLAKDYFKLQDNILCPPIVRAAYSDRMAWILASMSHLAYDHFEDPRDSQKVRRILAAKLASGGFKLIKTFNDKETDTQAFIAKNDQFAVLAFRGTEVSKIEDIKIDAMASKLSVLDGRVHAGFRHAYESIAKDVEETVLKLDD